MQRASASKRRWRNWPPICGVSAATSVSAKLLASSRHLLAGSVRDFVWHSGDNGKHPVVVGQLSWHWAYVPNWLGTPPGAAAVPGTSPTPRPYPSRFPRPISNRSVSRIWRMRASVTISNRRVRTRTHGGVAGVSGQPLPLCRSNGVSLTRPAVVNGVLHLVLTYLSFWFSPSGTPVRLRKSALLLD